MGAFKLANCAHDATQTYFFHGFENYHEQLQYRLMFPKDFVKRANLLQNKLRMKALTSTNIICFLVSDN
jgi:hypothetical protein